MTIPSRLLKSCAMPPVNCPTVSIFCACSNCSSVSRALGNIATCSAVAQKTVLHIKDWLTAGLNPFLRNAIALAQKHKIAKRFAFVQNLEMRVPEIGIVIVAQQILACFSVVPFRRDTDNLFDIR